MKKFKLAAAAVLAASLCLTACGGSSGTNSASYKEEAGAAGDYAYESYAAEEAAQAQTVRNTRRTADRAVQRNRRFARRTARRSSTQAI